MSRNLKQHGYKLIIQFLLMSFSCILINNFTFAAPNTEGIQVYQKNLHLFPEHKQKLADDITRYRNADNLWDVLRDEFALSHYENNPAVQEKIQWFMNNQDFLLRSASRAGPYLYYILQQVRKRHLPAELVLVPIIESGYNPYSLSNMGAAGIWQLMPDTASGLGIKRDFWYDGRRDVIASTRAALNYLAYLQSFFEGNWLLAIAAYNTGEGNVLSAIKRSIRAGQETDFWSLPLAQQTKDYVPSLLALAVIISRPDRYPVYFPPVRNAPYLAQVDVGKQINLKYAASLAALSYKKLMQLNPGFNRPSTSTKGPYKLVLPIENVEQFTENLARSPMSNPINWIHYKVKTGDTLALIAKRFNTTPNAIRKLNHLSKNPVHHGVNLLIPTDAEMGNDQNNSQTELAEEEHTFKPTSGESFDVASYTEKTPAREEKEEVAPTSSVINLNQANNKYTLLPGDTVYITRKHDTWETIARRFRLTTKTLQAANPIGYKKLAPGKELIIPTHSRRAETSKSSKESMLQPGDTVYMVRRGDTIEKIAARFHTSPAAIRLTNLIDNRSLAEGERIIVPTHIRG